MLTAKLDRTKVEKETFGAPKRIRTSLQNAVPVSEQEQYLTIYTRKLIIEKQSKIYKVLLVLEAILLLASSLFIMSLSAAVVIFAMQVLSA